jgi:Transcriptional regulators
MNIKEMAKLAGVSCATISRVLNDSGYVKEDTRKKVMEIIKEYNYTPNMIARSLSSTDSFNIGVIIPNVGEKQYGKILEGIAKDISHTGYRIVFMDSENDLKTEKKWLDEVKTQHMTGLVSVPVCSEHHELRSALQGLEAQATAVVLTEKQVKDARIGGVFPDGFRGAYEGVCRLIAPGLPKISFAARRRS